MGWLCFGLLLLLTAGDSDGDTISVSTERYTKVTISRMPEGPDCSVCVDQGSSQTCDTRYTMSEAQTYQVNFTCSRPQDIFTITITRDLDCSKTCNYGSIQADWTFFQDFNRTFIWDMKVSSATKSFQLTFPDPGMRQIQSIEQCPDKHTYSLIMYLRSGPVNLGTLCQNGTITRVQLLWKGRLSLEVPKDTTLSAFSIKYTEAVGSVLAVDAVLPRGQTNTDFFSASGLPPDYTMIWNFVVPPKHNFTVDILKYNLPECQSKAVNVKYQQAGVATVNKAVTDKQPANYQGNFSLLLTNCDAKTANGHGLWLYFRVSVFRSGFPDVCTVDLQNGEGLSLQIENNNPNHFCEIGVDAVVMETVVVPAGSKVNLFFLDCLKNDLILTANKTIECQSLSMCPVAGTLLTVPDIDSCLPASLSQVTWVLNVPEQGAVELTSPQGNLHQSVPGAQECDGLLSALVSTDNGDNVGLFCTAGKGIVQRVQISSNVTVTVTADGDKDLKQLIAPVLNVSFGSGITENMIYTVSPRISTPALLMTPNWPGAMKPDSTVSYIVNVPEEYSAELSFSNVSWPQCRENHAEITVQEMGSADQLGFREDVELVIGHSITRSFYLNTSNCEPAGGKFAFLSKISLQKKPKKLLSIILGVVAALLAVLIIILIVVCLVLRKKKQRTNKRSSIFFPKGAASLPGDASFSKTQADESHVYTYIDDTMVYGDLMEQDRIGPGRFNGHQVDSYKTFTGPMDTTVKDTGYDAVDRPFLAPSETFMPSRPRTPLGPLETMDYEDRRMVDNVLYTFKTPGDPNPVHHTLFSEPEAESWSGSEQPDPEYEEAM